MQDYIQKYQKKQRFIKTGIILSAFAIAFGAFSFTNQTEYGKSLQANILGSNIGENQNIQQADLYLSIVEDTLEVHTSKPISQAQTVYFTVAYDPDAIEIAQDISTPLGTLDSYGEVGLKNFTITVSDLNGELTDTLLRIPLSKTSSQGENISLLQAGFETENEQFLLSTSGTIY